MKNSYIHSLLLYLCFASINSFGQARLVKDIWPTTNAGGVGSTAKFTEFQGKLFFAANGGANLEVWVSDGTVTGTTLFKDINPSSSSTPDNFFVHGDFLYFSADDGTNSTELFISDGTEAGTFLLKDINPSGSSAPNGFTYFNGEIYFSAANTISRSSSNAELWKTDGTSAGTVLVKEINPNSITGSNPTELTVYNNKLYFIADDGTNGKELWSTDGTEPGTTMVKHINTSGSADVSELTLFNGQIYFQANDGVTFSELWSSDGTEAGTSIVKDISASASAPYDLTIYDNTLFFVANDGTHGYELWKTDGTEAGTLLVKDINTEGTSNSENLHAGPNALYFTANEGTYNKELWKSDGTEAGTVLVKDIYPGSSQSNPNTYFNYNGKVYFKANDGTHGVELWATDGTEAGTVLVDDIWDQDTQNSDPRNFVIYNNTLLFSAARAGIGRELFKYNHQVTWIGSRSTDWNTSLNWDTSSVPTASDDVLIFTSSNIPHVSEAITVNSITINSDAALDASANITANSITLESGASLITSESVTAPFTQKRTVNSTDWHLISVPLSGETIEDLRDGHPFATGTGTNVGIGTYLGDGWNYYTSTSSGSLTSGHGIAVKLTQAQDISFTGSMETEDVSRSMLIASSDMNLLGNPYPSYLPANISADDTNNILTINSGVLTEQTLWFWNPETNSYDQVNQATAARFIEPGEGFFVSTAANGDLFSFTELMQNHKPAEGDGGGDEGGGDEFVSRNQNTTRPEIQLQLTNETEIRKTDIFYIEGTTTGFDNGFDSTIFIGSDEYFQIYTQHIDDGYDEKLGIQSIPNENFETSIVPIGIKASAGTDITISATTSNLPSGVYAYLEDKERNTFTLLNDSSRYQETLSSDLNGIGRFYLHTSSTLGVPENTFSDQISVYQTNKETLRIAGIQQGEVTLNIHNILGQNLIKTTFVGSGINDISLPKIASGLYIITLESIAGSASKKIVIR